MTYDEQYQDALRDVRTLVQQNARGPRKTLSLSPEVAALLEKVTAAMPAAAAAPASQAPAPAAPEAPAFAAPDSPDVDMQSLATLVSECRKCGLCETRSRTVFGVGNLKADLVFVGEAPGADEDREGIPFVGRAGQLLTDIIEKGMKLRRDEVYICNVLKCRPPDNRNPSPEEVAQCEPYLLRQIELIRPKVICALGKFAAQTLLKTEDSVGRMRGKWHDYHGIPLRVTYHPSYLLRKPEDKKFCWEDVQEIMKRLEKKP
jgi:DNA polymerase